MASLDLQPFLRAMPQCCDTELVATVVECLQDSDRAIVTDESGHPQGLLAAHRLLNYLRDRRDWEQPLTHLDELLIPVMVLPVQRRDNGVFGLRPAPHFLNQNVAEIVAVEAATDGSAIVLGLLDRASLYVYLTDSTPPPPRLPTIPTPIDLFARLLHHLPFPLRLQSNGNEAIAQNQLWQIWQETYLDSETLADLGNNPPRPNQPRFLGQFSQTHDAGDRQCWQLTAISLSDWVSPSPISSSRSPLMVAPKSPSLGSAKSHATTQTESTEGDRNPRSLWLLVAHQIDAPRQKTQELTAKNADLEQIDRQKTELLSWAGHELKTPLTSLIGLSNLLQHPKLGNLNERQAKYARLIQSSSRQMMAVVNDLCDLAQLENNQLILHQQTLSVRDCSQQAYDRIRRLYEGNELPRFALDIKPNAETAVGDRSRLCQILVYLLANAVRGTPPEGQFGLRVEPWQNWLAFVIWDTGVGIQSDLQPWIFQSYQFTGSLDLGEASGHPTETNITPSSSRTGLGLILAQRLARLHGGEISFVSREQYGSQFTLLLPNRSEPPASPLAQVSADALTPWFGEGRTRFALVVDGETARVESLVDYLAAAGYRVLLARSGPEALAKARQMQPRAIFLNPVLPMLSGWDVLTLLKADAATQDLPVVLLGDRHDRPVLPKTVVDWLPLPVERSPVQSVLDRLMAVSSSSRQLTLLWLVPSSVRSPLSEARSPADSTIERLFHQHHYRVVEVDDLEQADMLAKVWKPDVVLLARTIPTEDLEMYLQEFCEYASLTRLPLVTLDATTTAAANRTTTSEGRSLQVFPCLTDPAAVSELSGLPAVLEVVQIAAKVRE